MTWTAIYLMIAPGFFRRVTMNTIFDPLNLALFIAAYLVGAISAAIVTCRILGLPDPRDSGSGNPGATNVLRLGGKKAALATLLGDMLKGLVPVLVAQMLGVDALTLTLVGLAAFLGHLYPVFFGFRGGKGVATALGALLGLSPWVGGGVILAWLVLAALFRYSSLAALGASATAPLLAWWQFHSPGATTVLALMVGLLYWRHRGNIARLVRGEEGKIGEKKTGG